VEQIPHQLRSISSAKTRLRASSILNLPEFMTRKTIAVKDLCMSLWNNHFYVKGNTAYSSRVQKPGFANGARVEAKRANPLGLYYLKKNSASF